MTNDDIANNSISINKIDNTGTTTGKQYGITNTSGVLSLTEVSSSGSSYLETITSNDWNTNKNKYMKISNSQNLLEFSTTIPSSSIYNSNMTNKIYYPALYDNSGLISYGSILKIN